MPNAQFALGENCIDMNGPYPPSICGADAAPQLHQIGHSCIVPHLRMLKVARAGQSELAREALMDAVDSSPRIENESRLGLPSKAFNNSPCRRAAANAWMRQMIRDSLPCTGLAIPHGSCSTA